MRAHSVVGILLAVLAAAIGWSYTVAEAVPVTFDFRGHVTFILNTGSPIGSLVEVGDPVLASLRYDTATPDTEGSSNVGRYIGPGWIKVRINGLAFEHTAGVEVLVVNDIGVPDTVFDSVTARGSSSTPTRWPNQLLPLSSSDLFLTWSEEIPISFQVLPVLVTSDALPISGDVFNVAGRGAIRGASIPASSHVVGFDLSPFPDLSPVPEPTTLLWGTTAAGLGLARWRQRRRKQQP